MITIDGFPIDAAAREGHTLDTDTMEYPVEDGPDVLDSARPKPRTAQLDGIVSDAPLNILKIARNESGSPPSEEAISLLERIYNEKRIVTIETTLKTYENMQMTGCTIPIEAETGEALKFSCTFQQALFVSNARAIVRTASPLGAGTDSKGAKASASRPPLKVPWLDDALADLSPGTGDAAKLAALPKVPAGLQPPGSPQLGAAKNAGQLAPGPLKSTVVGGIPDQYFGKP